MKAILRSSPLSLSLRLAVWLRRTLSLSLAWLLSISAVGPGLLWGTVVHRCWQMTVSPLCDDVDFGIFHVFFLHGWSCDDDGWDARLHTLPSEFFPTVLRVSACFVSPSACSPGRRRSLVTAPSAASSCRRQRGVA